MRANDAPEAKTENMHALGTPQLAAIGCNRTIITSLFSPTFSPSCPVRENFSSSESQRQGAENFVCEGPKTAADISDDFTEK